jgi:hypothetical protein
MKGEDVAALRRGIELIGELRFHTGGFVSERQWLAPLRINIEQTFAVLARLPLDAGQRVTFGLSFDRPDRLAIGEE